MARRRKVKPKADPQTPEEIVEELRKIEEGIRAEPGALERYAKIAEISVGRLLPKPKPLGEPWKSWVAELPEGDRPEGTQACWVWLDMIDLHRRLRSALEERRTLTTIHENEARRVMDVRMWEFRSRVRASEEAYRKIAEPFFARHGRPPLLEVVPTARPGTAQERAVLKAEVHAALSEMEIAPTVPAWHEGRWETWLTGLPTEARSEALRVRVLYDDMIVLRHSLVAALDQGDEASFAALRPRLARLDEEYRKIATPLFKRYGEPELRRGDSDAE